MGLGFPIGDPAVEEKIVTHGFVLIHRGAGLVVPFVFPLAPQQYHFSGRARGQLHQTLDDHVLDDFSGPRAIAPRLSLRGTFGGRHIRPIPGNAALRIIEAVWEAFNGFDRRRKADARAVQEYIDLSRLHFWRVWVDRFEYRRSDRDPLLIYYDIGLVRLDDYLSPVGPHLPPSTAPTSAAGLGAAF